MTVPSSTSSSDLPTRLSWGRSCALAAALTLVALGAWELSWRARGFEPSLENTTELWARERSRLQPDSVVLAGASRIQAAVSPTLLGQLLERAVVQLAIPGAPPLPLLEQLAAESEFHGLVFIDLVPRIAFDASGRRELRIDDYLRAHEELRSPAKRVELQLRLWATAALASRSPALHPRRVLGRWQDGLTMWPSHIHIALDRHRQLDFTKRAPGAIAAHVKRLAGKIESEGRPARPREMERLIERYERCVVALAGRGGEVVFVHMPRKGPVRRAEERRYPRRYYWELLAVSTSATTIHCDDWPALADFECPDGSHLDIRDTGRFTRALVETWRVARTTAE
jgi:hypothetical protein